MAAEEKDACVGRCIFGICRGDEDDDKWECDHPSVSIRTIYGAVPGQCPTCPGWKKKSTLVEAGAEK
ncbi:hypothetical protein ACFLU6_13795 [Acidobacteriota bacterium]